MSKEKDFDTMILNLEDGEVECGIVTILKANDKEYIALSPLDKKGEYTETLWLYGFLRDPKGGDDHQLIMIEDDEELEIVYDKYEEWIDTVEFDEM